MRSKAFLILAVVSIIASLVLNVNSVVATAFLSVTSSGFWLRRQCVARPERRPEDVTHTRVRAGAFRGPRPHSCRLSP